MKRINAIMIMCCILLVCTACGNTEVQDSAPDASGQTQSMEPSAPVGNENEEDGEGKVEVPAGDSKDAADAPEDPDGAAGDFTPLANGMSGNPADYDASVPATNILRNEVQDKFTQELFEDGETGLSIDFNLFLPENYGSGEKFPIVVFLSDSSLVGKGVNAPVIQCRGAMIWATAAWQEEHPCMIAVPQFNTTVINDNDGQEEVTEYVEAVRNLILMLCENYDVDTDRIYGMGQSMGCMVTMYLDAKYEDLYTACLFVDGQWNINQIEGLKDRKFIYFAAQGDQKASTGMAEVKELLSSAGVSYSEVVWNAQDDQADLNALALEMLAEDNDVNFVSWLVGSVVGKPGEDGGMREHMASFDFAYRQTVIREWLFMQSK